MPQYSANSTAESRPTMTVIHDLTDEGPIILATVDGSPSRFRYGTDVQHIRLPHESGSVGRIVALDALEHVYDEQDFLAECARLLGEGGQLRLRVPVEGPTAWLDAVNVARYTAEITGFIPEVREPKPTGWHRHYRAHELVDLVTNAGFDVSATRRVNGGIVELPHAAALIVGRGVFKREGTEQTLFRLRRRLAGIENAIPAGFLGTRLEITAWRT